MLSCSALMIILTGQTSKFAQYYKRHTLHVAVTTLSPVLISMSTKPSKYNKPRKQQRTPTRFTMLTNSQPETEQTWRHAKHTQQWSATLYVLSSRPWSWVRLVLFSYVALAWYMDWLNLMQPSLQIETYMRVISCIGDRCAHGGPPPHLNDFCSGCWCEPSVHIEPGYNCWFDCNTWTTAVFCETLSGLCCNTSHTTPCYVPKASGTINTLRGAWYHVWRDRRCFLQFQDDSYTWLWYLRAEYLVYILGNLSQIPSRRLMDGAMFDVARLFNHNMRDAEAPVVTKLRWSTLIGGDLDLGQVWWRELAHIIFTTFTFLSFVLRNLEIVMSRVLKYKTEGRFLVELWAPAIGFPGFHVPCISTTLPRIAPLRRLPPSYLEPRSA